MLRAWMSSNRWRRSAPQISNDWWQNISTTLAGSWIYHGANETSTSEDENLDIQVYPVCDAPIGRWVRKSDSSTNGLLRSGRHQSRTGHDLGFSHETREIWRARNRQVGWPFRNIFDRNRIKDDLGSSAHRSMVRFQWNGLFTSLPVPDLAAVGHGEPEIPSPVHVLPGRLGENPGKGSCQDGLPTHGPAWENGSFGIWAMRK